MATVIHISLSKPEDLELWYSVRPKFKDDRECVLAGVRLLKKARLIKGAKKPNA